MIRVSDSWKRDPKHRKYGDGKSNSPTKWNNQSHSSPKTVEKGNTVFIGNAGLTANVLRRLAEPFGTIHRVDFDKGMFPLLLTWWHENGATRPSKMRVKAV